MKGNCWEWMWTGQHSLPPSGRNVDPVDGKFGVLSAFITHIQTKQDNCHQHRTHDASENDTELLGGGETGPV